MLDPIQLQSFVDGECDANERREIIHFCEANQQYWRKVALAFIEEQTFSKDFSRFEKTTESLPKLPEIRLASPQPASVPLEARQVKKFDWKPFLAASIAGALMFAGGLTADRWYGSHLQHLPSQSSIAQHHPHSDSGIAAEKTTVQHPVSEKSLPEIVLPNASALVRAGANDIPLYEAEDVDPAIILAKQDMELKRLQKHWKAKGYAVDVEPSYLAGEMSDGRKWVIPVHELNVTPYGQ